MLDDLQLHSVTFRIGVNGHVTIQEVGRGPEGGIRGGFGLTLHLKHDNS